MRFCSLSRMLTLSLEDYHFKQMLNCSHGLTTAYFMASLYVDMLNRNALFPGSADSSAHTTQKSEPKLSMPLGVFALQGKW